MSATTAVMHNDSDLLFIIK